MIRTQIQLTEEQLAELRARAARLGISVAGLVRRAVDELIAAEPSPGAAEIRRRAIGVAGRFASGRTDVARRHDEHLANAYRP